MKWALTFLAHILLTIAICRLKVKNLKPKITSTTKHISIPQRKIDLFRYYKRE